MHHTHALALVALVALTVGCTQPSLSTDDQPISLAGRSLEGEIGNELHDALLKTDACTLDEFNQLMLLINPFLSLEMQAAFQRTDAEIEQIIQTTKACNPAIDREVEELGNAKYLVSYSLGHSDACSVEEFTVAAQEYGIEIEVDIEQETVEVLEGKLTEESAQKARRIMPAFYFVGNCMAPVAALVGLEVFAPGSDLPDEVPVIPEPEEEPEEEDEEELEEEPEEPPPLPDTNEDINAEPEEEPPPVPDINADVNAEPEPEEELLPPAPSGGAAPAGEIQLWRDGVKLAVFSEEDNPHIQSALDSGAKAITLSHGSVTDPSFHDWAGPSTFQRQGEVIITDSEGSTEDSWTFTGVTITAVISGYDFIQTADLAFDFLEKTG